MTKPRKIVLICYLAFVVAACLWVPWTARWQREGDDLTLNAGYGPLWKPPPALSAIIRAYRKSTSTPEKAKMDSSIPPPAASNAPSVDRAPESFSLDPWRRPLESEDDEAKKLDPWRRRPPGSRSVHPRADELEQEHERHYAQTRREAEKNREAEIKEIESMAYMRIDLARLGLELAVLTGLGGIGFLLVPSKSR